MNKMSEICWMSAVELIDAYKKKRLSPVEVVQSLLERIAKVNPKIKIGRAHV